MAISIVSSSLRQLRRSWTMTRSFLTATSNLPQAHQTCKLRDGRSLGFAEFGDPYGKPVLYFHGTPGSRLEAGDCNEAGKKTGARIIGTDRPGIGLSTWKKDYKLKDWPEDIADLCDHLNLQDVHVLGGSGGGIYAMACARYLGEKLRNQRRLKSSGILAGLLYDAGLSGVSWQRYIAYKYNMYAPRSLLKFTIDRELVRPAQDADPAVFRRTMVKLLESLPEIEQRCLRQDAESFDRLIDVFRESMTQGSEGYLTDTYLQFAPLPFPLESVHSKVKLYYGDSDGSTPLSMGQYAQERLPNASLKIFPGEGHFSLFFHHGTAIVADLIADD